MSRSKTQRLGSTASWITALPRPKMPKPAGLQQIAPQTRRLLGVRATVEPGLKSEQQKGRGESRGHLCALCEILSRSK
jgi:hypothetical protein